LAELELDTGERDLAAGDFAAAAELYAEADLMDRADWAIEQADAIAE